MEKKTDFTTSEQPNSNGQIASTLPVKFNKQTLNLSMEEAAELAQKGMKFDSISEDLSRLKKLAAKKNLSITGLIDLLEAEQNEKRLSELLEKCSGDRQFAGHIMKLESETETDAGFEEVKKYFPDITGEKDLPESVLDNAALKGSRLLDEYLRYLLINQRSLEKENLNAKKTKRASIGSQTAFSARHDPANLAFLQGIWNK